MIENDKKTGNYRANFNYTKESIYMMAVYDRDGNGKLNYQELFAVGFDVVNEKISDEKINRKIREI